MASGTNLGTAYFTLLPSMTGTAAAIGKELGGSKVTASGKTAGRGIGSSMVSGMGAGIMAGATALGGVVASAATAAAAGIGGLFAEAIDLSDAVKKFESTMQFAGFDQDAIDQSRQAVQDYAAQTVYDLGEVSNTAAQLAANGIPNFVELTTALGNLNAAAGGSGDTFGSVAMALTQTVGAGKLTTENWNQIADAIPGASGIIQQELAAMGAYTGDFRQAMAEGQITADEFNQALLNLGMTEAAQEAATSTKTMEGAVGNARASITTGLMNIFNAVNGSGGLITGLITSIGDAVGTAFNGLAPAFGSVAAQLQTVFTSGNAASVAAGLTSMLAGGLSQAFTAISSYIPTVMSKGAEVARGLAQGISAGLPGVIASFGTLVSQGGASLITGAATIVTTFAINLVAGLPRITTAAAGMLSGIVQAVPGVLDSLLSGINTLVNMVALSLPSFATSLITAATTLFSSIATAVPQILTSVTGALGTLMGNVATALPGLATTLTTEAPKLFQAIVDAVPGLLTSLSTNLTTLVSDFAALIPTVSTTIATAAPQLFQSLVDEVPNLLVSITTGLTTLVTDIVAALPTVAAGLTTGAPTLFQGLIDAVPGLLTGLTTALTTLIANLATSFPTMATNLATTAATLFQGIVDAVPGILASLLTALTTLLTDLAVNFPTLATTLATGAATIWQGIVDALSGLGESLKTSLLTLVTTLVNTFPEYVLALTTAATSLWDNIVSALSSLDIATAAGNLVQSAITKMGEFILSVSTAAGALWGTIVTAVTSKVESLKTEVSTFIQGALDKIAEFDLLQVGIDFVQGFIDGLKSMAQSVIDTVTSVFTDPIGTIKGIFGIASPSKLMFEFGGFVDEGFADGIRAYKDLAVDAMADLGSASVDAFNPEVDTTLSLDTSSVRPLSGGNTYNINIDGMSATADGAALDLLREFVAGVVRSNGGRAVAYA